MVCSLSGADYSTRKAPGIASGGLRLGSGVVRRHDRVGATRHDLKTDALEALDGDQVDEPLPDLPAEVSALPEKDPGDQIKDLMPEAGIRAPAELLADAVLLDGGGDEVVDPTIPDFRILGKRLGPPMPLKRRLGAVSNFCTLNHYNPL